MTALVLHVAQWLHDQVEQAVTGAATPLRPPPAVPDTDEASGVVEAEWTEGSE